MNKAVIFAPFWRHARHVGNYRVDRFVRWLAAEGIYVVLVRAGSVTGQRSTEWGVELTVRDPIGLYRDSVPGVTPVKSRRPNRLRRMLVRWLFNPDPGVLWARVAAKNPTVLEHAAGASFVISSSPPESAHIGASALAKNLKAKLIIDMRDGWLDEPLKPLLRNSRLQRWRESRLESSILQQAKRIFVTTPIWKSLLGDRLPCTQDKTIVLTNGYPPEGLLNSSHARIRSSNEPLRLVHAGRFTGSSLSRKVNYLLAPLMLGLDHVEGVVTLVGGLEEVDIEEINKWIPRFKSKGWTIEVKDAVPRDEMMSLLNEADGLLLLSASHAAIPSKLFEYLSLGKPIFSATLQSSAVWDVGASLEQLFLTDYQNADELVSRSFISASAMIEKNYKIPDQFSEEVLSKIFLANVLSV